MIVFRILKVLLMNLTTLMTMIRCSEYMWSYFLRMSMKLKVTILTHVMIFYVKVLFQVIQMKFLRVSQKVAKNWPNLRAS